MSSVFKDLSASISMPSATSLVQFSKVQLPNILSSASEVATWTNTTLAIVLTLLILEQSVYRYKKKHLPGDSWTIPIIGKFADSMKPTMEGYMKQWNAGALSALSVFNMSAYFTFVLVGTLTFNRDFISFIVMASSTEYSRKILNSPAHAEPCLVYSAKQVLRPENW
jgi:C-22 sterol desaturase